MGAIPTCKTWYTSVLVFVIVSGDGTTQGHTSIVCHMWQSLGSKPATNLDKKNFIRLVHTFLREKKADQEVQNKSSKKTAKCLSCKKKKVTKHIRLI